MKITIQALNFTAKEALLAFVEKRLNKLSQFYDKIISVDVKLKELPGGDKNKGVEILLNIPGDDLIVKKTANSFEEALDENVKALERSLRKWKERQNVKN